MPGALDHLIAFYIVIVWPWYGLARSHPRFLKAVARGEPTARLCAYRDTIAEQWLATGAVVGAWWWAGRSWDALGLGAGSGWRPWLGAALAAVAVIALTAQARVAIGPAARASVLAQLEPARPYLPHTRAELRRFFAVSVTAGTCEELLFRGFLLWYFAAWLPLAAAVSLAAVCFAVVHLYAGLSGAVRAGMVGLVLSALYLGLGSLWAAMAIHAAIDISSGWIAQRVLADEARA